MSQQQSQGFIGKLSEGLTGQGTNPSSNFSNIQSTLTGGQSGSTLKTAQNTFNQALGSKQPNLNSLQGLTGMGNNQSGTLGNIQSRLVQNQMESQLGNTLEGAQNKFNQTFGTNLQNAGDLQGLTGKGTNPSSNLGNIQSRLGGNQTEGQMGGLRSTMQSAQNTFNQAFGNKQPNVSDLHGPG